MAATYTYDPKETNSEATVAAATKDGKLYAYPLTASNGYFLYYDSNIFSEEDVASWENLTAKAEEAGTKVGMNVADGWYLYGFFSGAGCELSMNEDNSNNCDWNSETGLAVAPVSYTHLSFTLISPDLWVIPVIIIIISPISRYFRQFQHKKRAKHIYSLCVSPIAYSLQ